MRLHIVTSLLFASLIKYSEQATECSYASLYNCLTPPPMDIPVYPSLLQHNTFCSNVKNFSNCVLNMSCQPYDSFTYNETYLTVKARAELYSLACANVAVWVENSDCRATSALAAFEWCKKSQGGTSDAVNQTCNFYQSILQCSYNLANLLCNPQSVPLMIATIYFTARTSFPPFNCNLTLLSSSTCTPCNRQCPYGTQFDNMGCQICSSGCINPCQTVLCPHSHVCVPVCNSTQVDLLCPWIGTCVPTVAQRCDDSAFDRCTEPNPTLDPYQYEAAVCSQTAAFDRCIHTIACNASDPLYKKLVVSLFTSSALKSVCDYRHRYGFNGCTWNASFCQRSESKLSCSSITQPLQCLHDAVKEACDTSVANYFTTITLWSLYTSTEILANMSNLCSFAQPWASPCTNCTNICQYGYATDAIGCNNCYKCNDSPCQNTTCSKDLTCDPVCNWQGTNNQCTAKCSTASGGMSTVKSRGQVVWTMVLYTLVSAIATVMMLKA